MFELASGVTIRKAIAAGGTPEVLRKAAVAEGMQPLQDAALCLVASGVTSLDEVQRALAAKAASPPPPAPPAKTPRQAAPAALPPARRKTP